MYSFVRSLVVYYLQRQSANLREHSSNSVLSCIYTEKSCIVLPENYPANMFGICHQFGRGPKTGPDIRYSRNKRTHSQTEAILKAIYLL